ncbi:hypothetical protein PCAR4_760038 [Paraburkholderia caribensis]|nr:hypothetical protein PCAR4_760038 [Paraburkholderia caribensis]
MPDDVRRGTFGRLVGDRGWVSGFGLDGSQLRLSTLRPIGLQRAANAAVGAEIDTLIQHAATSAAGRRKPDGGRGRFGRHA